MVSSMATFLGPARLSYTGASDLRQFPAACSRSLAVIWTFASFSTSANVAGETSGPKAGAVPNAGGAPAGGVCDAAAGFAEASSGFVLSFRHAAAVLATPKHAYLRNCLRDFAIRISAAHLNKHGRS